jgi:hypothetical protein
MEQLLSNKLTQAGYIVLCAMGFAALSYGFADSSPQPHYDASHATMVSRILMYLPKRMDRKADKI